MRSALVKSCADYVFSVTCTTRERRPEEVNGRDYFFVTAAEFMKMKEKGELLEWAEVHGNYYGTPVKSVTRAMESGRFPVMTIDVKGAASVRAIFPEALTVFLLPPSLEVLKARLRARGEKPERIDIRLKTACEEIKEAYKFDYLVVNDKLADTVKAVENLIKVNRMKIMYHLNFIKEFEKQLENDR